MGADAPLTAADAQKLLDGCGEGFSAHLKNVVKRLLVSDPGHGYDCFNFIQAAATAGGAQELLFDGSLSEREIEAKLAKAATQGKFSRDPDDGEGNLTPMCAIPNFLADADMFGWAGAGFSTEENLAVMNALKHFPQADSGVKKIRLWGKVLCSGANDYYIVEGKTDNPADPEAEPPAEAEPIGVGANTYGYWACTDLSEPVWTRLPDALPSHVAASASTRKILAGDLDADVLCYPPFPGSGNSPVGKERDLLRSIIARISGDTTLTVEGYMTRDEDSGEIAETEEFVFPSAKTLAKPSGWCHFSEHVLSIGRSTYPEIEDNEENAEALERQGLAKAAEPEQLVLRGVVPSDWGFRIAEGCSPSVPTVLGRSLRWPGAVVAAARGQFTNLYVGYGLPQGSGSGSVPFGSPPVVQDDPDIADEVAEPQPEGGPPKPEEEEGEEA